MNIWLEALRRAIRFEYKGLIDTEDLFKLSPIELDGIYQAYARTLRDIQGDSLVIDSEKEKEIEIAQLKVDIIKGVFDIKQKEAQALREKIANNKEKQRILSIIADKEDEELKNKSLDELREMAEDL